MAFTLSPEQSALFNLQRDSGQLPEVVNHPSRFFIAKRTLGDRSLNPGTIQSLQNLGMRHI